MTAPDYNTISDVELAPGKPITSSLLTRLRDALLSVIGGGLNAPLIDRLAISAGGTGTDGGWVNATTVTGLGYFEPTGIVISTTLALPGVSVIRVNGDVTISGTVTVAGVSEANAEIAGFHLRATTGQNGVTNGAGAGGGGANVGSGGNATSADGGAGYAVSGLNRDWLALNPKIGGRGGASSGGSGAAGANGGGSLILLVEGNVVMTGGTINADGQDGPQSGGNGAAGGGAGGSIIIIATGTITDGTYTAKGGNSAAGGGTAGGVGGGGRVVLAASAFAGARTKTVTKGATGFTTGATDGQADEYTLTAAQIRGLMFRSY